jgi:hypothetical protein
MQYFMYRAGVLLVIASSISAMEKIDSEPSPLTILELQITGYERDPLVKDLAEYFKNPHSKMQPLPAFDDYRSATLIVNALLLSFKAKEYPVDKLGAANNTLRPSHRSLRLATYALDNVCRAWNQTHEPNPYDDSPKIPLAQLERDYLFALRKTDLAIRDAKREDKDATHVAQKVQSYLRLLTKNK